MTQYLLSVHSGNGKAPEPMTDEKLRQGYEQVGKLETKMRALAAFISASSFPTCS